MKKIIIEAAVLAVCAGGTAYAYQYFVEENPKNAYFKAEAEQFDRTKRQMGEVLKTDLLYTNMKTGIPFHQKLQLSGKVKVDGMDAATEQQMQPVLDLLEKSALRFEQTMDEPNAHYQLKLGWDYNQKELLSVEAYTDSKLTALKVPQLLPSYVTLQNDKVGAFAKKLDPSYEGPEAFNFFDYFKTAGGQEEDLKAYAKDYFKLIYENIRDDQVTFQKIDYTTPYGETQKLREYTLTLSDSEVKGTLELLLSKAETDDKLLDFIVKNANPAARLNLPAAAANGASLPASSEELKQAFSKMKEELAKTAFTGGFQMKVVTDKDGRIVDRKINTVFTDTETKEGIELAYASSQWEDKGAGKGSFAASIKPIAKDNSKENLLTLTDTYTYDSKAADHALEWKLVSEGEEETSGKADYHREKAEEAAGKLTVKQTVKVSPKLEDDQYALTANLNTTKTGSEDGKKTSTDSAVEITVDSKPAAGPAGKVNVNLAINQEMEQLSNPSWPEFTAANSRELSTMTEEDMAQLQNDLMGGVYKLLFSNEDLLELLAPFM
ncbi:DUF6583 family protein [Paenibacillus sp. YN15]|uniref:DUF6583 family protein n=1 Tax=Paenibacillus sp. YN15 TaxID=1742774 RepID=UPI000DCE2DF6|nr:DUF6583 family protein [Paenibacillus sp. YN15]RAV00501.1 hypothetical protein DQG13_13715 [Paenibacillus sp. YN15]